MKVVAAYLLAVLGGKAEPSAADVTSILSAAGAEADSAKVEKLLSEMAGKSAADVIAAGSKKLASVPSGGAAPAGGAAAAPAAGGAPAKEEKKKKEEPKEEEEEEMGFSLFD
jgi:large subunit ribosomal protein LP2